MVAIAYGLLPNKIEDTYRRYLLLLTEAADRAGVNFTSSLVQVDFELAMMRAIAVVLPETRIRGCFFRYTQCVWRKVQELGLSVPFRSDRTCAD